MENRISFLVSIAAAVAIAGAGIYAVLQQAALIVDVATPPPAASIAPAPSVTPPADSARPPAGIYRCEVAGQVVYSDAPCSGAKLVDVTPTRGYEPPRGSAQRAPEAVAETRGEAPTAAPTSESKRASECRQIEDMIAWIDSAARQGGTIQYMEELNEKRRKLVDRRYELRC